MCSVFHADAINSQKTVSAGVDLALGLLLLAVGALVATGRLHGSAQGTGPGRRRAAGEGRRRRRTAGRSGCWLSPGSGSPCWSARCAASPAAPTSSALHILVTSKSSTANQVIGVILFVLIEFLLIIIPFAFLELRPEATKAALKNAQDWLAGPRPPAHGLHRPGPGRLPGDQRPGAPDLTCHCAPARTHRQHLRPVQGGPLARLPAST